MQVAPRNPVLRRRKGDPVLWAGPWRGPTFGQDAGDVRDATRSNRSASRGTGMSFASVAGATVLRCTGSAGGYAQFPGSFPNGTFPFTLFARFATIDGGLNAAVSVGTGSHQGTLGLFIQAGFVYVSTPDTGSAVVGTALNDGQLHSAAAVFRPSVGVDIYADGRYLQTCTFISPVLTGGQVNIAAQGTQFPFNGDLYSVSAFTRDLSHSEIAREHNDPFRRLQPLRRTAAGIPHSASNLAPVYSYLSRRRRVG